MAFNLTWDNAIANVLVPYVNPIASSKFAKTALQQAYDRSLSNIDVCFTDNHRSPVLSGQATSDAVKSFAIYINSDPGASSLVDDPASSYGQRNAW